jgi:hypothetical protein
MSINRSRPSVAARWLKPPSFTKLPVSASAFPSRGARATVTTSSSTAEAIAGACKVKSAHTVPKNGYTFHACGNLPGQVYTSKEIDFFVAYVVPADAWYVLPIEVFTTVRSVKLFPSSKRPTRSRFEKYRDAWHYFGSPKNLR